METIFTVISCISYAIIIIFATIICICLMCKAYNLIRTCYKALSVKRYKITYCRSPSREHINHDDLRTDITVMKFTLEPANMGEKFIKARSFNGAYGKFMTRYAHDILVIKCEEIEFA